MSLRQQLQDPGKKGNSSKILERILLHLNILSIKIKMEPPTGMFVFSLFAWKMKMIAFVIISSTNLHQHYLPSTPIFFAYHILNTMVVLGWLCKLVYIRLIFVCITRSCKRLLLLLVDKEKGLKLYLVSQSIAANIFVLHHLCLYHGYAMLYALYCMNLWCCLLQIGMGERSSGWQDILISSIILEYFLMLPWWVQ